METKPVVDVDADSDSVADASQVSVDAVTAARRRLGLLDETVRRASERAKLVRVGASDRKSPLFQLTPDLVRSVLVWLSPDDESPPPPRRVTLE